jgi:hypothetical protein
MLELTLRPFSYQIVASFEMINNLRLQYYLILRTIDRIKRAFVLDDRESAELVVGGKEALNGHRPSRW